MKECEKKAKYRRPSKGIEKNYGIYYQMVNAQSRICPQNWDSLWF